MKKLLLVCALFLLGACYLGHYPVTAHAAEEASYKVFNDEAMGTAWAVDLHHLVTAGHVCEVFDDKFVIVSNLERRFHAKSVISEYSRTHGTVDLCVLETQVDLPNFLVVADEMPAVGAKIGYVGYPLGVWGAFEGKYLGDLDGPDEDFNDDAFSAPCDHGASGAAVFTERGVWGVLVRLQTQGGMLHPGTEGCVAIPLKPLRAILEDAHIKYTSTPPEPTTPFGPTYEAN